MDASHEQVEKKLDRVSICGTSRAATGPLFRFAEAFLLDGRRFLTTTTKDKKVGKNRTPLT